MLNGFWIAMVLASLVCGALSGRMDLVGKASTDSAKAAVELALGLIGVMAFWIGGMRVLQQAGILHWIANRLAPVMGWLFPDVPKDHPAMSMMIMNMTSNMLGLGNAATPFGLKAMVELDKLNDDKGTATDAMALFLAINTSSIAILPTGMIAIRASLGANAPGSIVLPTMLATLCSTLTAIFIAKVFCRLPRYRLKKSASSTDNKSDTLAQISTATTAANNTAESTSQSITEHPNPPLLTGKKLLAACALLALVCGSLGYAFWEMLYGTPELLAPIKTTLGASPVSSTVSFLAALKTVSSHWVLPLLIGLFTFLGLFRDVKVYDCLVEGGKEGFDLALKIIPYLVAILVAVGMLRASGAIDLMVSGLEPLTSLVGMPAEALPMAMLRSLTGSGALAVSAEIMQTHGADSLIGRLVSTMQGSTETTFYVLALYFGVVQIKRARHTLIACLAADTVGMLAAVWAVRLF